jgi:holo-[acyl-carrier protein] synthase
MPRDIGIDLVSVNHLKQSLADHGDRFLERVYTPQERRDCAGSPARLAERFAAKEATMKALRRGDEGFGWQCIEVVDQLHGPPAVRLSGGAAALAARQGIRALSLSMTRQRRQAAAVVVVETDISPGGARKR